jgi:hypothetical protein
MTIISFFTGEPTDGDFVAFDEVVIGATSLECVEYLSSLGYEYGDESAVIHDGRDCVKMVGVKIIT